MQKEKPDDYRKVMNWLKRREEWPLERVRILNIYNTLVELGYGEVIRRRLLRRAREIHQTHKETIEKYLRKKRQIYMNYRVEHGKPLLEYTSQQAIQEQLLQGFVKRDEFLGYEEGAKHCISLVDKDLIYPYNFNMGLYHVPGRLHITESPKLVGVQGFTRITQ